MEGGYTLIIGGTKQLFQLLRGPLLFKIFHFQWGQMCIYTQMLALCMGMQTYLHHVTENMTNQKADVYKILLNRTFPQCAET